MKITKNSAQNPTGKKKKKNRKHFSPQKCRVGQNDNSKNPSVAEKVRVRSKGILIWTQISLPLTLQTKTIHMPPFLRVPQFLSTS